MLYAFLPIWNGHVVADEAHSTGIYGPQGARGSAGAPRSGTPAYVWKGVSCDIYSFQTCVSHYQHTHSFVVTCSTTLDRLFTQHSATRKLSPPTVYLTCKRTFMRIRRCGCMSIMSRAIFELLVCQVDLFLYYLDWI